jgi:hypothetical protein
MLIGPPRSARAAKSGSAGHLLGWHKSNLEPVLQSRPKPVPIQAIEQRPFDPPVDEEQLKQKEAREETMKSERDGMNPALKPSGTGSGCSH